MAGVVGSVLFLVVRCYRLDQNQAELVLVILCTLQEMSFKMNPETSSSIYG